MSFIVLVKAEPPCRNVVVITELESLASVFGGNKIDGLQNTNGPVGDVLEIADRRGDEIERAG